jgi:hypothetical protein
MRRVVVVGAFAIAALACAGAASAANLVMNPGFETVEGYIGPWATATGVWKGDVSFGGTSADQGVTPIGKGMLRFLSTRWTFSHPNGVSGDLLQFIDLTPFATTIAAGQAKVRYAAKFNRVGDDGSGIVDTSFSARLFARSGTLTTFFDDSSPKLAFGEATIITDDDLATWQEASGTLAIPPGSTHLALQVRATENVRNDSSLTDEFAGHYADEVVVEFVPEPGTGMLTGAALLLAAGRRRTRTRYAFIAARSSISARG